MTPDVAVVILTYNEDANLAQALESVCRWAREVYVVDSYSTDATLAVAGQFDCHVVQNRFEGYAAQRNWAIDELPIESGWILFLDADEWLTKELKEEITRVIASNPIENGFFMKWRLLWMGSWVRRGYYPTWILRLFRHGQARCEDRSCNEHLVIEGKVGFLKADFIHEDRKSISDWIAKHNRYATLEATELLNAENQPHAIPARFWRASQAGRKRWLRYRVWGFPHPAPTSSWPPPLGVCRFSCQRRRRPDTGE